jgi:GNAT superfamily N-acetyltransferase
LGNNILEITKCCYSYLEVPLVVVVSKMIKYTIEIKRMFVSPEVRGMGFAQTILLELEAWAHDLGYSFSVLEPYTKQKKDSFIKKQDIP